MDLTPAMQKRAEVVGGEWRDEGDGYASLVGHSPSPLGFAVAYIALPAGHHDIGKHYDSLWDCPVNGGLTYANDNVFGWDYGHYNNPGSPGTDIPAALTFFHEREKVTRQT